MRIALPFALALLGCAPSQPQASTPTTSQVAAPQQPTTAQPRGLTPLQVQQTIKANLDHYALCAQTSWAKAKGRVELKSVFVVQPNGSASNFSFVNPPPDTLDLQECVRRTTLSLAFPKADLPTDSRYPFYFEPLFSR